MLHAIIEIYANHLIGKVVNFFFKETNFSFLILELLKEFCKLYSFARGGNLDSLFDVCYCGTIASLLFVYVVRSDTRDGIGLITVHIDEALEAILLSAVKLPINRAFLINLDVISIELVEEV